MQPERHDFQGDDFAEVWRSAHRRRSEDVAVWFTSAVRARRRLNAAALFRSFARSVKALLLAKPDQAAPTSARTKGERGGY